jgi:hypothetical protein
VAVPAAQAGRLPTPLAKLQVPSAHTHNRTCTPSHGACLSDAATSKGMCGGFLSSRTSFLDPPPP